MWVIPEEDEFYELVQTWRKEHPQPPKKAVYPNGRLGEQDEDDDEE
jgi:hypothetical protein